MTEHEFDRETPITPGTGGRFVKSPTEADSRNDVVTPGPPLHPTFTSYPTPLGEHIKLLTFKSVLIPNWQDFQHLTRTVEGMALRAPADRRTELWDDQWYFVTTLKGHQSVMAWVNMERQIVGFVMWSAEPRAWVLRSNCVKLGGSVGGHPDGIGGVSYPDGTDRWKLKFPKGITGGAKLEIDLENPSNESDDCGVTDKWTPCDMIVSWGR